VNKYRLLDNILIVVPTGTAMMDMEIVDEGFFVITIAIIRLHQHKYLQHISHNHQQQQQQQQQQHHQQQLSSRQQQHINHHHRTTSTYTKDDYSTFSLHGYDVIFYCYEYGQAWWPGEIMLAPFHFD
jgi:Tfp pilus assembly protein PilV